MSLAIPTVLSTIRSLFPTMKQQNFLLSIDLPIEKWCKGTRENGRFRDIGRNSPLVGLGWPNEYVIFRTVTLLSDPSTYLVSKVRYLRLGHFNRVRASVVQSSTSANYSKTSSHVICTPIKLPNSSSAVYSIASRTSVRSSVGGFPTWWRHFRHCSRRHFQLIIFAICCTT